MKKSRQYTTVFWMIAMLGVSQGCSTCKTKVVNTSNQGEFSAELDYRDCGIYSGYSVAIYSNENGPLRSGEGEKEPFKAVYKSESRLESDALPITIEWIGVKRLLIRHQTRMGLDDHAHELMVIKAETEYQGVRIEYEPDPVVWE